MRLKNKVVLVTGAASGIGYSVVDLFAREGAAVFASDIALPKTTYSEGIETLTLDVIREDDWAIAVDIVIEKTGRIDVLINHAGVFLGMREVIRVMRRQKSGSIVNISSICGSAAVGGAHPFHAAKGAVRAMAKNAAITYVADGIRVNSVRGGKPIEVAYGCLLLASDESSYITGAELVIDGGDPAQ